jgi:hypothetical protein
MRIPHSIHRPSVGSPSLPHREMSFLLIQLFFVSGSSQWEQGSITAFEGSRGLDLSKRHGVRFLSQVVMTGLLALLSRMTELYAYHCGVESSLPEPTLVSSNSSVSIPRYCFTSNTTRLSLNVR